MLSHVNCKLFRNMMRFVKSSPQGKLMKEYENFILTDYLKALTKDLKDGVKNQVVRRKPKEAELKKHLLLTKKKLLVKYGSKLCSYIYWAHKSKIPLKLRNLVKKEPRLQKMC